MNNDTIFALSSGRPPAAVSVIRISGPLAHDVGRRLAGTLPKVRQAGLRTLRKSDGTVLDEALVLRFDRPSSATGEHIVELQCHGGRAIVDAILDELSGMDGLRSALPGEFTRRAFENGRIDLTEAEGLADLLEAETESQRRSALAMAEGGLRRQVSDWQARVISLSARAEAAIDYVDDEDDVVNPDIGHECAALADELSVWIDRPRAEPLRDGIRAVVAGPPNAGKSSLINAIVGQERAIVTDIPGTTRDHIEVPLAIEGMPMILTDTAGLRATDDVIEGMGVARARTLVASADLVIWMGDPTEAPDASTVIRIHGRADLPGREIPPAGLLAVSAKTGMGLSKLVDEIGRAAKSRLPADGDLALNRRQAAELVDAREALRDASGEDVVLIAENLRRARAAFDRLTGRAGLEDVFDALFKRFCLGK